MNGDEELWIGKMQKIIKDLIVFLLCLFVFFFFINFFNVFINLRDGIIVYFMANYFNNFLNTFMLIIKYIYIYKFFFFNNNFLDLFHEVLFFFYHYMYILLLKIKIYLYNMFLKFIYIKHIFEIKTIFKAKGYSEYFLAFFFKPTYYRFFSFYIFFILFFITLDWTEHFFESIDNIDSEFEIDFEPYFSWDNDPLFGKNFLYLGQRLALEKTSEGPDLYKSNEFFYQSKKSKFNKYNREFLGGPEYLNLLDLFSTHETFHQIGSYEFFGPGFIVIFVSFESDFEFEFFFFQKFFSFLKEVFISKNFTAIFFNMNISLLFENMLDIILYFLSYLYLFFKYIYKYFNK